jgi:hypothetical protein
VEVPESLYRPASVATRGTAAAASAVHVAIDAAALYAAIINATAVG